MFTFLKPPQLLDDITVAWVFDSFAWALRNFDARLFIDQTILVTPSNAHFPGNESSAEGMARLVFDRVRLYAGMRHWPCRLVDDAQVENLPPPALPLEGLTRTMAEAAPAPLDTAQALPVICHLDQLRDPEVMIAHFAHTLAHYLGTTAGEPPPGGEENWPHVTELLAVFMGFGVAMADSAHTAKIRSCGSCSGPAVERENYLSQFDVTYALALFCCLKDIPTREAARHLKSTLRPFFKKAMKDVVRREPQLQRLREMLAAA